MNAKQAKKLRRAAEAATVGKPSRGYQPVTTHLRVYETPKGPMPFPVVDTIRLTHNCGRSVYKKFKAMARATRRFDWALTISGGK